MIPNTNQRWKTGNVIAEINAIRDGGVMLDELNSGHEEIYRSAYLIPYENVIQNMWKYLFGQEKE